VSFAPGARLGPYEITAKLGEGGMGEVYRATDTKLKRDVAIKVLPQEFTADKERLARFEREAQLLAQLHHPNIASIFGLEESDGTRALVMELVEGPTLAERLEQGPLPFNESLSVSLQIAHALEEAHEKGIVHRDLKPQNIKASIEGKVKVLDFGLAKAMDPAAGSAVSAADLGRSPTLMNSPTLTAVHGTQLGVILGTAAYMAPEQAKGLSIDKRADIWAFGVVLFEMLSGRSLFAGDTVTDTLAGVLKTEIDFSQLPESTPAAIRRLLRRCLERNLKNRLHDIADARLVLEDALAGRSDESAVSGAALAEPVVSRRAAWRPWLFGFVLGAAAIALVALLLRPRTGAPRPELLRFTISSASGAAIAAGAGNSAISPDGRRVVFLGSDAEGRQGLWIQELDQVRARLLAGTEGASYPFWAPDSRRVAFFAKGMLNRVSLVDGRVEPICDAPEGRGGSWGRGGAIVFAPAVAGGLFAVAESGGSPKAVTQLQRPEEESSHRNPSFLPDGKRFVYIADPGANVDAGRVFLASLDGGERRFLYRARRAPVFAEPGFLIDAIDDRLVARRFDPESGELSGEPLRLEETTPGYVNTQDRAASVSTSGALLVPSAESGGTKITWLDRRGRPVGEVPLPKGRFDMPRLSPDGRRLVVVSALPKEGEADLWVVDLATEQASRLSFAPGEETYPVWSPDGERIVFQTKRGSGYDLWIRPSSGAGVEQALYASPTQWKLPLSWVGGTLAFGDSGPETGFDVSLLRPDRPSEAPRPLLASAASELEAAISPDERWLAYTSNESGRDEVYVVSLPDAKVKYQVTTEGGQSPHWTRGGRELIFLTSGFSMAAVPVTPGDALAFGTPVTLFPKPRTNWGSFGDVLLFDVTADGERIVLLEPLGEGSQTLIVVTDWLAELGAEGADR
jgi:eukaryotic-like serine/threonine-protein kinase